MMLRPNARLVRMLRMQSRSWDLKLERARQHLDELSSYTAQFTSRHGYEAVRDAHRDEQPDDVWRYVVHFTEHPDERVAVVVGDVVHNVRSALDHVMVALVSPRREREVFFPIFNERVFDDHGAAVDTDQGRRWASITRDLDERIVTQLRILQPFQEPEADVAEFCRSHGIDPKQIHALSLLNRLDNADKHRRLPRIIQTMRDVRTVTTYQGGVIEQHVADGGLVEAGTEVAKFGFSTPSTATTEVDVQITGTVTIALDIGGQRGGVVVPDALTIMIEHATDIIRSLEPHARS